MAHGDTLSIGHFDWLERLSTGATCGAGLSLQRCCHRGGCVSPSLPLAYLSARLTFFLQTCLLANLHIYFFELRCWWVFSELLFLNVCFLLPGIFLFRKSVVCSFAYFSAIICVDFFFFLLNGLIELSFGFLPGCSFAWFSSARFYVGEIYRVTTSYLRFIVESVDQHVLYLEVISYCIMCW